MVDSKTKTEKMATDNITDSHAGHVAGPITNPAGDPVSDTVSGRVSDSGRMPFIHRYDMVPMCWLILKVLILSLFFAEVEIQIEGAAGWATSLPTWRIEHHWLLDLFWGGRAMTGYHAWVFIFIALIFHFPFLLYGHWSRRMEARVLACIMFFWAAEDGLWFILNPAYGWEKFTPEIVRWHHHWLGGVPTDYWFALVIGTWLMLRSYRKKRMP